MGEKQGLSAHIQDSIAFLAITSSSFLKLIRGCVKPDILTTDAVYRVIKACYVYYDLTREAPGDHIVDVLEDELKGVDKSKKELVYHFVDRISQMRAPNLDYVVSKLSEFTKTREFELAAVEFVKLVERGEFDKAELRMHQALRAGIEREDKGCEHFIDPDTEEEMGEELLTMGLEHFDSLRKFHREELVCILGGYKGKKSWACSHIGKQGLMRGLNVLHLSHENSLKETRWRYDRMFGSLASADYYPNRPVIIQYMDENSNRLKQYEEVRPNILDSAARKAARKTMRRFGGRLIIKKYPMGSCDMREVERQLDYLERYENFVPDVFINDYPDIMKPMDGTKPTRDQLNETYIHHKRLVDERKMLGVVPSQATRAAIRSKKLGMKDFAEDIRKLANIDTAIGVCQTDVQADNGLGTLYVVAARVGKMDCGCGIVMNLDIGQFASGSYVVKLGVKVAEEKDDSDKDE